MEPKKIAFGFSKTTKKPNLSSGKPQPAAEKIELISCVEENAIKIVGKEHGSDEPVPLVIPLRDKDKKTIPDRLAKLMEIKNEKQPDSTPTTEETLEQKAAREILEDLKHEQERTNEQDNVVVPLKPEDLPLDGAQESTLDDYESVPIEQFGLAMLRGMGWKGQPKDVKSSDKLPDGPIARPKGLGLGAERPPSDKNRQLIPPSKGEVLVMRPGVQVKVLTGKYANSYGTVESLDEENSRALLRFALGRNQEYVHEHLLQLVSKAEYDKYSKVLNSAKYEEYKNRSESAPVKEEKKPTPPTVEISSSPEPTDRYRQTDRRQHRRHSRSWSRSPKRDDKRKRRDSRSPARKQRNNSDDSDDGYHRDRNKHKSRKDERKYSSDEDDRRSSKKNNRNDRERDRDDRRDQRRRSRTPEKRRERRRDSSDDSDDSDDRHYRKSKKSTHDRKRERSRDRRHSSEEDDRHHRKKSKKSKKKKDYR